LQTFRFTVFSVLSILLFTLWLTSCGSQPPKSDPDMRTPAFQWFLKGRAFLGNGEYIQAEIAFNKALDLRQNFAPALDGLAQVYLEQNHTEMAEQYVQSALKGSPPYLPARLTEARLLIRNGEFELAHQKLNTLAKIVVRNNVKLLRTPVLYYSALVAFKQNRFGDARKILTALLNTDANHKQGKQLLRALNRKTQLLQKFPEAVRPFVFKPFVTRIDLVRLLHYYFSDVRFSYPLPFIITNLYPKISLTQISDINRNSEEAKIVEYALNKQLIWAFPDGTFHPQEAVSRAEFALILQRLYLRLQKPVAKTNCAFKLDDVPKEDFIFRAVCIAVTHQWLHTKGNRFLPESKINGLQATRALQKLKNECVGK